jgi:hypothetical protein
MATKRVGTWDWVARAPKGTHTELFHRVQIFDGGSRSLTMVCGYELPMDAVSATVTERPATGYCRRCGR